MLTIGTPWILAVGAAIVAMLPAQPVAPVWRDVPPEARAGIQDHLADLVVLPNGEVVDLWPARERQRVAARATVERPVYQTTVGNGVRQRRQIGTERELTESRQTRAWGIVVPDQRVRLLPEVGLPSVAPQGGAAFSGELCPDGELLYLWASPDPAEVGAPFVSPSSIAMPPEPISVVHQPPPAWDYLVHCSGAPGGWTHARTHTGVSNDDAELVAWVGDRGWRLIRFENISDVVESATNVQGDLFRVDSSLIRIPRQYRGEGYIWLPNVYDPDAEGSIVHPRDLMCSRDEALAAIAGHLTIQTWTLASRNGADAWERGLTIDAALLATGAAPTP